MSLYSQNYDDRDDLDRERFSEDIDQQGFSEKYMRTQGHASDCRCSDCGFDQGIVGKLIEMGTLHDGNGDEVVGVLIECSKADLQACNLQVYGEVWFFNAPRADSFGGADG